MKTMCSKLKKEVIRVQSISNDGSKIYDVSSENGVVEWTHLISYSNTDIDAEFSNSIQYESNELTLDLPYACDLCPDNLPAPYHTLYCLVVHIVKMYPSKTILVEKISCSLSKLSSYFYKKPVWELNQEIRSAVKTKGSVIKLKDDFCVLNGFKCMIKRPDPMKSEYVGLQFLKGNCELEDLPNKFSIEENKLPQSLEESTKDHKFKVLKKKRKSLSWMEIIAIVLKDKPLKGCEIIDRAEINFPEEIKNRPNWKMSLRSRLYCCKYFQRLDKKRNSPWFITSDDYKKAIDL